MQFTQSRKKDMWSRRVFLSMEGERAGGRAQHRWKEGNFKIISIRIIHEPKEYI